MSEFPPFPAPPEGVEIVPFRAFNPAGYRCVTGPSGDPIEVDAWAGIPTIKVLNEQEVKEIRRANRKRKVAGTARGADGRVIPWWEEWEEDESLRTMNKATLNGLARFEDRIHLAADDFRVGRMWPEISLGVRLMWDQFRLYIGLLSSIPVYKKIKNKGQTDAPGGGEEPSDEEGDVPKAKHTKADPIRDYLEQSALPGKKLEPSQDESTVEAQRLRAFLGDIEKTIKVFLSSYMRDRGLIWTEKNLLNAPTILHFFLRFMHRNRVFADSPSHLNDLERAISVAALARKELPTTAELGHILPSRFDVACKECWGTQGSLSVQISATLPPTTVDESAIDGTSPQSDDSSVFETEIKEGNVEIVPSNVVLDSVTARQVMEDSLDTDYDVPVTAIPAASDPWTAATLAEEYTTASWTDVSVPWLMQFLGPTALPLTMTTGIVEYSTRRIRNIIPPGADTDRTKLSPVEEELANMFFRVAIRPWVTSALEETPDFPRPVVAPGSKGAVIIPEMMPDGVMFDEIEDPWNPYQDDVTILVDKTVVGQMVVGMGLCGTWVEMVAECGDRRHGRENYWYVESLVAIVPSYYTEGDSAFDAPVEEDDLSKLGRVRV